MNVLVYAGPGTTVESVAHCTATLRLLLSPYYSVHHVNATTLCTEPWQSMTALLAIPGGADLPYCQALNGEGNSRIAAYVNKGGRYLGFCAGGYYGSGRVEFEAEDPKYAVVGSRELKFFPGTNRGTAFPGFVYDSERGARAAKLRVEGMEDFACYYNGGGLFVDADKYAAAGVSVLARYVDPVKVEGGDAAVVHCRVGRGSAVLTGAHPEFSPKRLKARDDVGPDYATIIEKIRADTDKRLEFMRLMLERLGLRVNENVTEDTTPRLEPLYFSAARPGIVKNIIDSLREDSTEVEGGRLELTGQSDTFVFTDSTKAQTVVPCPDVDPSEFGSVPKNVIVYQQGIPDHHATPLFDHNLYYRNLRSESFGTAFCYSEVVTSTSTMLDHNMALLKQLPTGFTINGAVQVAGKGRGGNYWVSPLGLLAFSTVIRHPISLQNTAPVVFLQYIGAMAIVEAIREYGPEYNDLDVRLKWPNDVYARNPRYVKGIDGENEYVKLSGILVNTNVYGSEYLVVIGCGINTANQSPTTSLNEIVTHENANRRKTSRPLMAPFRLEPLLAGIMSQLETMYSVFKYRGFEPFMELYYKRWLHSGAEVRLDMYEGERARIRGITSDYGMLEVEQLNYEGKPTGKIYTLQPDGNSFDIFKGLLRKKTVM
ncbi:biotin-protein ligase [Dipodascopsis tothii]|uniref:biotin-protein ligase n=1 Tax=Dipodascopsis tothii TaxID=44089 RepID=UPI0034CFC266